MSAHGGAIRVAEDLATILGIELDAADPRRLALRHARNGAGDGRGGAAGAAAWAANGSAFRLLIGVPGLLMRLGLGAWFHVKHGAVHGVIVRPAPRSLAVAGVGWGRAR